MEPSAKRVKQMREAACHDVTSSTREAELEKQIEQTKRKLRELEQDLRAERAEKNKEIWNAMMSCPDKDEAGAHSLPNLLSDVHQRLTNLDTFVKEKRDMYQFINNALTEVNSHPHLIPFDRFNGDDAYFLRDLKQLIDRDIAALEGLRDRKAPSKLRSIWKKVKTLQTHVLREKSWQ